ncbi:sporulation integral membrane protein YtvI [Peptoniphilus olsenii]|uniref:Sporulation integral membrane protein YtvI n=1 Tax=Peptoniphilus olsenii TaxID=411570 RepID=A0ABV2J7C0_9FIRM
MLEQFAGNTNTARFVTYALIILAILLMFLAIYYLVNIGNRYIDPNKRLKMDLSIVVKLFVGVLSLYLIRIIFGKYPILGYTLSSVIIAIIFAYIMDPLVNFLERKGIKRKFGVIIVYISVLLLFGILIFSVIPKSIQEFSNLLSRIPDMLDSLNKMTNSFLTRVFSKFNIKMPENFLNVYNDTNQINVTQGSDPITGILNSINKTVNEIISTMQKSAVDSLRNIATKIYALFTNALRIILILIFSFYFSVDKEKFNLKLRRLIPNKYRRDVTYLGKRIDTALQQFIRGRLLMAIFVGVATMIYLLILRVDFAIVIGLITCVADIIPYIGPFLGYLPAVLFAFMDSPVKAFWVTIIFVTIQWAENNILAPKLIGNSTGLDPLLILISIIIGGGIFGVWGMVISVPVVSVFCILIDFLKIKYSERHE